MTDTGQRRGWAARQALTGQVVSPWLDAQPTGAMSEAAARDWARRLNAALAEQERAAGNEALATVAVSVTPVRSSMSLAIATASRDDRPSSTIGADSSMPSAD